MPNHSRTRIVEAIDKGSVLVEGVHRKASFQLRSGMTVEVREIAERPMHDLTPADLALDVRFEDEVLLVVNKPRGLATHPAPSQKQSTLVNALLARSHTLSDYGGSFRPGIVHRLDKETTGLLVVAKTDSAHRHLADQIKNKTAERRYVVGVGLRPTQDLFVIDAPLARDRSKRDRMCVDPVGKSARTQVKFLRETEGVVQLAVRLETGRTHQIRVHLAAVGMPACGDHLYNQHHNNHPLQLHAGFLAFAHPITGANIEVFAEPPQDFIGRNSVVREDLAEWPVP